MMHQSVKYSNAVPEVNSSSPISDFLQDSDKKVREQMKSNKFNNEASDSGYASRDSIGLKASLSDVIYDSEPEFLIDENTRLSFGSIHEGNESLIDIDMSSMTFGKGNFGKYSFGILQNIFQKQQILRTYLKTRPH